MFLSLGLLQKSSFNVGGLHDLTHFAEVKSTGGDESHIQVKKWPTRDSTVQIKSSSDGTTKYD